MVLSLRCGWSIVRVRSSRGSVFTVKVIEVNRGSVVRSFSCKEEVLVLNLILYWEPVKLDDNRGDVVS